MTGEPAFRSRAFGDVPVPDFADVVIVAMPPGSSSDPEVWADAIFSPAAAPAWVRALFALRELLVRAVGIPRARSDVFAVREVVGEEALIVADDTHLDFRAGIGVDPVAGLVRITTVVRLHGWRGRLYFAPVSVLHGPVLRAMALRAARRLA